MQGPPPPPPLPDGPHVLVYVRGQTTLIPGEHYKVPDASDPTGFICLPGTSIVEVRPCRHHNNGCKLYCTHDKEKPKCKYCRDLGLGGGSSYCGCGRRRADCPLHQGTNDGVVAAAMPRGVKRKSNEAPASLAHPGGDGGDGASSSNTFFTPPAEDLDSIEDVAVVDGIEVNEEEEDGVPADVMYI